VVRSPLKDAPWDTSPIGTSFYLPDARGVIQHLIPRMRTPARNFSFWPPFQSLEFDQVVGDVSTLSWYSSHAMMASSVGPSHDPTQALFCERAAWLSLPGHVRPRGDDSHLRRWVKWPVAKKFVHARSKSQTSNWRAWRRSVRMRRISRFLRLVPQRLGWSGWDPDVLVDVAKVPPRDVRSCRPVRPGHPFVQLCFCVALHVSSAQMDCLWGGPHPGLGLFFFFLASLCVFIRCLHPPQIMSLAQCSVSSAGSLASDLNDHAQE
jgi:hypothetical protein